MTEGMPPTLEQTRQLNRSLTEKVLDRAASDPQWKQQLLDDPEAAMRMANFPETQQLQQMQQSAQSRGAEVTGQHQHHDDDDGPWGGSWGGSWGCSWTWYCMWWTWNWDQS
jgi:hypothetical protein